MDTKYVNLHYLKSMGSGSDEFIADIINEFIANIPKAVSLIKIHLKNSEWEKAEDISHRIRPTFNILGMDNEADILNEIEMSIQQNKFHGLDQLISKVDHALFLACEELNVVLKAIK